VRLVSSSGKGGSVLDKPYELKVVSLVIDLNRVWKMKLVILWRYCKIILLYTKSDDNLTTNDKGELTQIAIAGTYRKFVWAKAKIIGNKIIVWNDNVQQPITVRYVWADNLAGANLIDAAGNFVSTFRTDNW
jgi:hypothetical protein